MRALLPLFLVACTAPNDLYGDGFDAGSAMDSANAADLGNAPFDLPPVFLCTPLADGNPGPCGCPGMRACSTRAGIFCVKSARILELSQWCYHCGGAGEQCCPDPDTTDGWPGVCDVAGYICRGGPTPENCRTVSDRFGHPGCVLCQPGP
jgi:hypothetical protein